MKKIEELGISPWPWNVVRDPDDGVPFGVDCTRSAGFSTRVFDDIDGISEQDARLIAAAPELYECLREAIAESCISYCGDSPIHCPKNPGECFVQKWRAALRKASGESEVADGK